MSWNWRVKFDSTGLPSIVLRHYECQRTFLIMNKHSIIGAVIWRRNMAEYTIVNPRKNAKDCFVAVKTQAINLETEIIE